MTHPFSKSVWQYALEMFRAFAVQQLHYLKSLWEKPVRPSSTWATLGALVTFRLTNQPQAAPPPPTPASSGATCQLLPWLMLCQASCCPAVRSCSFPTLCPGTVSVCAAHQSLTFTNSIWAVPHCSLFNRSTVDLQYCIRFRCTAKLLGYISFLRLFSLIDECKILNVVPCVIQ